MKHTYANHARLFALLTKAGVDSEQRKAFVTEITAGKFTSSSDLTDYQVETLCKHLEDKMNGANDACDHLRKKILSCCHELGWYKRNEQGDLDLKDGDKQLDFDYINAYCLKHGHYHKALNDHKLEELQGNSGLVFQFNTMLKNYLKNTRK